MSIFWTVVEMLGMHLLQELGPYINCVQESRLKLNLIFDKWYYSQVSRRAKSLHKRVNRLTEGNKARHIIFDSTGFKVHGEGEWKVKVYGKSKRWTWRKFHIGIDAETQGIICCELTGNNKGDVEIAEQMLDELSCKVKSARVDCAYDASRNVEKTQNSG